MISIQYSPISQSFFIMWNESVLSVQQNSEEVRSWLSDHDFTVTETWGGLSTIKRKVS